MTLNELINILLPPHQAKQPTQEQNNILRHQQGPGWVLAGPGSGKTEVLTWLVMRLLYVKSDPLQAERVNPDSIFVTTFTNKAARNLEDRISHYRGKIITQRPDLAAIDISKLHIDTLHGLCNDILQEYRAPNYQNVRLMDELESSMFIYEQMSIIKDRDDATDRPFWTHFSNIFSSREWQTNLPYLPSKWNATVALVKMFNRIVEDRVSISKMRNAGGQWKRLADLYEEYAQKLKIEHRCDFSHLQLEFLKFLQGPIGKEFRDSGGSVGTNGITWVLIDEYQDTNRIQEEIYLTLAHRKPYNVIVVGDDDQAMYRFRGGSVECMVTFDEACQTYLGVSQSNVPQYPLLANFRSHPEIVNFCNNYITSFPSMKLPGARVPNKQALVSSSSISGSYPAVGQLRAKTLNALADRFAETVEDLVTNGIVRDLNQCCLLLKSTKESPHNAEPYVRALQNRGISYYNPRNKAFLEQEEVCGLLGTLLAVIDPHDQHVPQRPQDLANTIRGCRNQYDQIQTANKELADYVRDAHKNLAAHPDKPLTANLQELVYYLLSLPPFDNWATEAARRARLSRITALVESFASMPVPGYPDISRGRLKASSDSPGEVFSKWTTNFYYLFFGYLSRTGIDEEENEDVIVPSGMVPIMTMHQAKGLQFPFVFVGHIGEKPNVSVSHYLETQLSQFPNNPARSFSFLSEDVRSELDLIRQYYVAYSRAQYALILMGTNAQFSKGRTPCGPNTSWLQNQIPPL